MVAPVVSNPNILVETPLPGESLPDWLGRVSAARGLPQKQPGPNPRLVRLVRLARKAIRQITCSSAWADDCLYRAEKYIPDFRCACPVCSERFPHRLHPRRAQESKIAGDCAIEDSQDPEFEEIFARLRNERTRVGSVFLASKKLDRGSGTSRRAASHRKKR